MATAKFDIKSEATRPLLAGVGATDLAVERVRGYVAEVQKRLADLDLEPRSLREQARTAVAARVDALSKDATARRSVIEARMAELQDEAKVIPTRVQAALNENLAVVNAAYADLAKRGETLVTRIRQQQTTQDAVAAAESTAVEATVAQAEAVQAVTTTVDTAAADATKAAKKSTTTAKRTSAGAKTSARSTATAAKRTAKTTTAAATEAASKVGD